MGPEQVITISFCSLSVAGFVQRQLLHAEILRGKWEGRKGAFTTTVIAPVAVLSSTAIVGVIAPRQCAVRRRETTRMKRRCQSYELGPYMFPDLTG